MEFRGRGFGRNILGGLAEYGFNTLGLRSIFASATIENIPAIRSLEKVGFRRIGVRRWYQSLDKRCLDEMHFDITKEEFIAFQKRL